MRALAISDMHFGAWTGRDILREQESLDLLARRLDDIDEVIILGDLFDLLFARLEDAFLAAEPLLALLREKLAGKRVVFMPGNHDFHVVLREREAIRESELAGEEPGPELEERVRSGLYFRRFLRSRLEGVNVQFRYPTYMFGPVLLTHGHYLDPHARQHGSRGDRLLGRLIWSIALGGKFSPETAAQYDATTALLTEELYTLAQLPHGADAQHYAYSTALRLGTVVRKLETPFEAVNRLVQRRRRGETGPDVDRRPAEDGMPASYPLRHVRPTDPREKAINAFAEVVRNLGWDIESEQIVFAHTHQPLAGRELPGTRARCWNTGSWMYEPDLSSKESYERYLRYAWPGTAVLLDTDAPEPQLLELRAHLNPLGISATAPFMPPG
jgi:UDP-2,3-diacylglucosamine pyrophosphatase LpxH